MKLNIKKLILFCSISLILCFLISCTGKKIDKMYTIGIVQIVEDPMLDLARNSLIETLGDEGFVEGKNIRIVYSSAQGEIPNISLILKNFLSQKVDMIITNSTPCMAAAAQTIKNIPVVFTVAFGPEQIGIQDVPSNLTGVYDPFEMNDFVRMMRLSVPALKNIGILYNPTEPNARFGADQLKKECADQNITVIEMSVYSSNDVLLAARSLAQKQIDAFAIAADNTVHLAIASFVRVAEDHQIPLFVTDPSQVERGACAGFGVDYGDWGRESGKIAAEIIRGKDPAEIPIRPMQKKTMSLNLKAAASQGITFPAELIAKADKVIE
ncbi:ABC transporter substrate-binding protein [candidate division KSB1 bacterium]|nr:ABC transporter substrate-binding protein [candidate division KSB1 bacterium]